MTESNAVVPHPPRGSDGTVTDGKVWVKTVDPDPHDIVKPDNVAPVGATLA